MRAPALEVGWRNLHVGLNIGFSVFMCLVHCILTASLLAGKSSSTSLWELFFLTWTVAGSVWTAANAYGLLTRAPWARLSAEIYALVSIFTFIGTPYGIYGAISLRLRSVRAALDSRSTPR